MRDALGLFKGLQRFFARRFLASELEGDFANVDALFEEARDGGGETLLQNSLKSLLRSSSMRIESVVVIADCPFCGKDVSIVSQNMCNVNAA